MAQGGHRLYRRRCYRSSERELSSFSGSSEIRKRCSVRAFKSLDLKVVAAGDSFNDVSMLQEANAGFFFKAPKAVVDQYPDYELADNYEDLKTLVETWRISHTS